MIADTSFLVALGQSDETGHASAVGAMKALTGALLVPSTVMTETLGLVRVRWGCHVQRRYWGILKAARIRIVHTSDEILAEAARIDDAYGDCNFGFVDATLLATCEVVRDARVLSFDSRLAAYRPSFVSALEVLP